MPIPDFQTLMRPLLALHEDQQEHLNRNLVSTLADQFNLSEEERRAMLPSGRAKLFANRVGWAKSHMSQAGLISSPRRAISVITPRGLDVLRDNPAQIGMKILEAFPEYNEFRTRKGPLPKKAEKKSVEEEVQTPEESFENAYLAVRAEVEENLLRRISASPPDFLERVVVDLVVKMGYGGSLKDAGEAIGKSGDEGIDGVIKEDPLGLDIIYLQAKRWEATIGRPEIQKFAGALQGQRATKGIFITTSSFSKGAIEYVRNIQSKIILIDGRALATLMYDHGVGVATTSTYDIKAPDSDYFEDL